MATIKETLPMKLIDKDALVAEIDRMMAEEMALFEESLKDDSHEISAAPVVYTRLQMLLSAINTLEVKEVDLQEEPVSEELGDYINELSKQFPEVSFAKLSRIAVRVAKWQKEKEYTCYEEAFEDGAKWKVENLWKTADGDDLPEFDREVIVLIKYNAQRNIHDKEYSTYKVGFGHRPNPDGWDGKNIDTNEVTHYTPKLYDKGGWNAPDIVYWLDVKLPKEIEL